MAGSAASTPQARGLSIFQKLLILTLSLIAVTITVPAVYLPARQLQSMQTALETKAETAPYFHDGSVATLPEAVQVMAQHQLGIELEQQEVSAIVAWLRSLTGKLPEGYIAQPQLPARAGGKDRT